MAAPTPVTGAGPPPTAKAAVDFLTLTTRLKTTKRTGWVRRGIPAPESVADHSFRVALTALVVAGGRPGVDPARALAIALAHDVAEAVVGDIAPGDGVPKAVKREREAGAVEGMVGLLGRGTAAGDAIGALWAEYEAGESPEAALVKDCDKVEMLLQAVEYETAHPGLVLDEFFDSVRGKLKTEAGRELAAEVEGRRPGRRG